MMSSMVENVAMFEALRHRFAEAYQADSLDDESANRAYIYLNAAYSIIAAISETGLEDDKDAITTLNKLLTKVSEELKSEPN